AVEVAVRLVQHNEFRSAEHGASQANQLFLPGGEAMASTTDFGLVPLGQTQDHFVATGELRSLIHLLRPTLAHASNVAEYCPFKEFDILRYIADMAAEVLAHPCVHIGAVQPDVPRSRF